MVMHSAGWLESGLVSCFEKLIVDIEILRVLLEAFRPVEISEESLAFSAHQEVGHGGHFLGAGHTLERFRTCLPAPAVVSTEPRALDARRRSGRRSPSIQDLPGEARRP
jgi:trimethylamine--corrinoid protein Co-methyltransferase